MKKTPAFFQPETTIIIDSDELAIAPPIDLLFDYSVFDDATAQAMQSHARKIKSKGHKIGSELIDIGGELAAAKERVGHGHWLDWLRDELQLNDTTARRLIAVHREFADQRQLASLFNPTVLQLMAGRSTPPVAKQEILERIQASGNSPTTREVREIIQSHKPSNQATLPDLGTAKSAQPIPPTPEPLTLPSHLFQTPITPAPAWAIQNHIHDWLADYQKTDHRPYTSIITDLYNRKPPAWTSLDAYLTQKLITYRREAMTTALSDTLTTLRHRENPTPPPALRFMSLPEITDLIWSVLRQTVGESSPDDAKLLHAALLSRPKAEDYTQPLQPGLTFSNQLFRQAWHHINQQLETALPGPQIAPVPTTAPVVITLYLEPNQLQLLKQHLKNGTPGRLPVDLIAELYQQLENQN